MLIWLSAGEERQYQNLRTCGGYFKRVVIAMLTGLLLMVSNLAEFVDEADRRELRRTAQIYSRVFRCVRFAELVIVLVLVFATPCLIQVQVDGKPHNLTLLWFCIRQHKMIFFVFAIAVVLYYGMVASKFHTIAVRELDNVAALDLPGAIDVPRTNSNDPPSDAPLLGENPSIFVQQVSDRDLPESLKEDLIADGSFYHTSENKYRLVRAPSLSFLLLSKGIHGSAANMVLARIDEEDALPTDNYVLADRVRMSDFDIEERLGSGAYASVWRCRKRSNGEEFAMKRLLKTNYVHRTGASAQLPRRERDTLFVAGRHENVAYLESAFETDSYWVIITELCKLGSLSKHIKRDGGGLGTREAKRISKQVLTGVRHLHNRCILHRDLKPDNVGLSGRREEPTAKLIDFGFAKRAEANQSNTIVGSYGYVAPEIETARQFFGALRRAAESHDERIDMYAYGVMLFVIFVGREAMTDALPQYRTLWSHEQFRGMLFNASHAMWRCQLYISKSIDGALLLHRMKECSALDTISNLTETEPLRRTRNCNAALEQQFFLDDAPVAVNSSAAAANISNPVSESSSNRDSLSMESSSRC